MMNTLTHQPARALATTSRDDLTLRDVLCEEAVVFTALTLVLLVTGAISGIVGVTALAGLTTFAAVALTIAHSSAAIAAKTSRD